MKEVGETLKIIDLTQDSRIITKRIFQTLRMSVEANKIDLVSMIHR